MKVKLPPNKDVVANRWRSESMWLITTSLVILAAVALAFAIAYTRKVMIPFVLALFIVTIVSPVLDFLVLRLKIPRILAATSTLIVVIFVMVLVCATLWQTGMTIVSTASDYNKEVRAMFFRGSQWAEKKWAQLQRQDESEKDQNSVNLDQVSPAPNTTPQTPPDIVETASEPEPEAYELSVTSDSLTQGYQGAQVNPLVPDEFDGTLLLEVTEKGLRAEPVKSDSPIVSSSPSVHQRPTRDLFDHDKLVDRLGNTLGGILWNMVDVLLQLLSNVLFVIIFVIFMLSGRNPRIVRTGVYAEIDQKIRRYIGTKVAISLVTGLLVWFSLFKLGIKADLAGVFGIMAFLLNFIPSLGSIISTLLPVPIALAQYHNEPFLVLLVVLIPGIIQMVMGNVIEPKLMGEGLNLHPVTILLALSFWGLLWGVVGMFLAAPMTAMIRIVLMQFDTLKPVGRLLAGDISHQKAVDTKNK